MDIIDVLHQFNTASSISMYENKLVVESYFNYRETFEFKNREERHKFLENFPTIECKWENGTIHEVPRSQCYTNYLKSWSEDELDGTTKMLCPKYDYIIMEYKEDEDWRGQKSIIIWYKQFENDSSKV